MRKAYCDKCDREIKEKKIAGIENLSAIYLMFDKCYDLCKKCKIKFDYWIDKP